MAYANWPNRDLTDINLINEQQLLNMTLNMGDELVDEPINRSTLSMDDRIRELERLVLRERLNHGYTHRIDHAKEMAKQRIIFTATSEGQSINTYFKMLESYVRTQGIATEQLMDTIHVTLEGVPSDWYWSLFQASTFRTFEEFKVQLRHRFGDPLTVTQLCLKASEMKFTGGDILAYVDSIVAMLTRGDIDEETQLNVIMNGFSEDIKRHLMVFEIRTVMQLIERLKRSYPTHCFMYTDQPKKFEPFQFFKAATSESVSRIGFSIPDKGHKSKNEELDPEAIAISAMYKKFKRFMDSNPRGESKDVSNNSMGLSKKRKCFNCGGKDHYFQECLREQMKQFCYKCGRSDTTFLKCNTQSCANRLAELEKLDGVPSVCAMSSDRMSIGTQSRTDVLSSSPNGSNDVMDDSSLFFYKNGDNRPYINMIVKGRIVAALVDTGSQVTVVGSNMISDVSRWGKLLPYSDNIRMANGSFHSPKGRLMVEYFIDGIGRTIPTIVMNEPTNSLIIGMDLFNEFGIGLTNVRDNRVTMLKRNSLDSGDLEFSGMEQIASMDMVKHVTVSNIVHPYSEDIDVSELVSVRKPMGPKKSLATLASLIVGIIEVWNCMAIAYIDDCKRLNTVDKYCPGFVNQGERFGRRNLAISPERSKFCYGQ